MEDIPATRAILLDCIAELSGKQGDLNLCYEIGNRHQMRLTIRFDQTDACQALIDLALDENDLVRCLSTVYLGRFHLVGVDLRQDAIPILVKLGVIPNRIQMASMACLSTLAIMGEAVAVRECLKLTQQLNFGSLNEFHSHVWVGIYSAIAAAYSG